MHIYDIKITSGPNPWSRERQKLVVMTLDTSGMPALLSNQIPGFNERLKKVLPTLASHGCHHNGPLSFFRMLETGIRLEHVVEHVAIELLLLAGIDCPYARRLKTKANGICEIVLGYEQESAVVHAGGAAVRIMERLVKGTPCNIQLEVDEIRCIATGAVNRETYSQYWAPPIPIHWI